MLVQYKFMICTCYRELDLDVFNILNAGLITKANLDSEMNTMVS